MRLVIDMQGAQGDSQFRGIGRYALSLTQAIIRNQGSHEILLAINGVFSETIEPIRATFDKLLPQENIRVWQGQTPTHHLNSTNQWRRHASELIYEAFLASLHPDVVLVCSVFEGYGDDVVTSIGKLSQTIPTAVIMYDLIPLINKDIYLSHRIAESWYQEKLDHLRRANILLAISESSRLEAIHYLGFPSDACINISAAVEQQFKPKEITPDREEDIRKRYGLKRQFLMYTSGGTDPRKNIEGLIRAYSKMDEQIRFSHQLAIVCNIEASKREALINLANENGLQSDEVILTGFISENDLITLYNLCKAFVFPSWHEGFGLPALEAMSCGRAVIAANKSSLPEVLGRIEALFDPLDVMSIKTKIEQILTDDVFRENLEKHSLKQATQFSWDITAKAALSGIEILHNKNNHEKYPKLAYRPKLAFVSPLPPERSGISDYSATLLPELSRHYDIEIISAQNVICDAWITSNCPIRTIEWFKNNTDKYKRVLYHFGNSPLHQHMFDLLDNIPGTVVLHDFYLSSVISYMDKTGYTTNLWAQTLYKNHGYHILKKRYESFHATNVVTRYPCNLNILNNAQGIIVHSEHSIRLAETWYNKNTSSQWSIIPLLRAPRRKIDKNTARNLVKLNQNDFVICSFGFLDQTKLNDRIIKAWLASALSKFPECILIFVGENHGGNYGKELLSIIDKHRVTDRILITGWTDEQTFHHYLAAADMAIQLRTQSRGETSAAVLDCMNYGLPTIVNANGSMADLRNDAVWKLRDDFNEADLIEALETLWENSLMRERLGVNASHIIKTQHDPRYCADLYMQAIEKNHHRSLKDIPALTEALSHIESPPNDSTEWQKLAEDIAFSINPRIIKQQLLVDISAIVRCDLKTGIERVVRNILQELLEHPPEGFHVEPVYASTEEGYRYARQFTLKFLGCPDDLILPDDPIDFQAGDIFLGLDLQQYIVAAQRHRYKKFREQGVLVKFIVYDLLPIIYPHFFPTSTDKAHQNWLNVITESDGAICISKSVADELTDWVNHYTQPRQRPFTVSWFHLGADIDTSSSSKGLSDDIEPVLNLVQKRLTFLMVGTIEPRKGHSQTLHAFKKLWSEGIDINLVIVGKEGWMTHDLINQLNHDSERGNRLFWFENISDEYLKKIYALSVCLIAASLGEGFGLPLIEAAQLGLPIIARDIPVFKEVAGQHALYFNGKKPDDIANIIKSWLKLYQENAHPKPNGIPWVSWRDSSHELKKQLLDL